MLETERLFLRRFKSDDWRDLYEYLSQEEVVKGHGLKEFIDQDMEIRKFDEIDGKANDNIVHEYRFGEANGFASEAFDTSSQGKIFTLNALSIRLADDVLLNRQMHPKRQYKKC